MTTTLVSTESVPPIAEMPDCYTPAPVSTVQFHQNLNTMPKNTYTSETAFWILSITDESSGELLLSDSDSEYEPVESSSSVNRFRGGKDPSKKNEAF